MAAEKFKRKLKAILSGATLGPLKEAGLKCWRKTPTILKALATLVIALNAAWQLYSRVISPSSVTSPKEKASVVSREKMALPIPDQPSIAVLPFVNLSGDPKQEFLCDGMTEEIITALSKVPRLLVIARSSTDTYKGKPVKVKQVSEELGVQYVLEGGLQRSGDRLRMTVQLIDAFTGNHLWAERYDRDLKDIFALQDEITLKILTGIQVKLKDAGRTIGYEKYYKGKKQGVDAYLKMLEATDYMDRLNIEDNVLARQLIEESIAMCPESPIGYTKLGWTYKRDYQMNNTTSPQETLNKSMELAQKALAIDDSMPMAHALLCSLYSIKGEHDKAITEGSRAVSLAPNGTSPLDNYAGALNYAGKPEEAIPVFQKSIRLNPFGPSFLYRDFGAALWSAGRFEEAVSALKKAIELAPNNIGAHINLAVTYNMMGREKEARNEAAEVLRINPKFLVASYAQVLQYKDPSKKDNILNALRSARLK